MFFFFCLGFERQPQFAGTWYDQNPKIQVETLLIRAKKQIQQKPKIIIVPHAGYVYSGSTAAMAYKQLEGHHYDTVILIGPCHKTHLTKPNIWMPGKWKTPLGDLEIDQEIAKSIADNISIEENKNAHITEHSLEVQLPFLQVVLKHPFKIVPILINDSNNYKDLAQAIEKACVAKNVLIVISSDLSHYFPPNQAEQIDQCTMRLIHRRDPLLLKGLESHRPNLSICPRPLPHDHKVIPCGLAAIMVGVELGKNLSLKSLAYNHSRGEKVVGYMAACFYEDLSDIWLTKQQQDWVVDIARETIDSWLHKSVKPKINSTDPILEEERAVFVTLRKKDGSLRGCIGSFLPQEPIIDAVQNKAIAAATQDSRFPPLIFSEFKQGLDIKVSVLGLPQPIESIDQIILGIHGVILKHQGKSAIFLPEVATEFGWTKEELLDRLCQKAGLETSCWKKAELMVFTSQES